MSNNHKSHPFLCAIYLIHTSHHQPIAWKARNAKTKTLKHFLRHVSQCLSLLLSSGIHSVFCDPSGIEQRWARCWVVFALACSHLPPRLVSLLFYLFSCLPAYPLLTCSLSFFFISLTYLPSLLKLSCPFLCLFPSFGCLSVTIMTLTCCSLVYHLLYSTSSLGKYVTSFN